MKNHSIIAAVLLLSTPAFAEEEPARPTAESVPAFEPISAEVAGRLTPEQLKEVMVAREESRQRIAKYTSGGDTTDTKDMKVAILVPLFFFVAVLLGIATTLFFRFRKERQLHETLRLMIDKGTQIPVELLTPPRAVASDFRRGAVLVGGGAAGCVLGLLVDGVATGMWGIGLIPMFIGAGYLLSWWMERKEATARAMQAALKDI